MRPQPLARRPRPAGLRADLLALGLAGLLAAGTPGAAGAQAPADTAAAAASGTAPPPATARPAAAPWTVAGAQGLVQVVIVPVALAREKAAYVQQVQHLCQPERTCFLNFYANPAGLPVALPLPDGIEHEATAVYRRSAKQGAERFIWSCRLGMAGEPCF
jgi:hypothetical protein